MVEQDVRSRKILCKNMSKNFKRVKFTQNKHEIYSKTLKPNMWFVKSREACHKFFQDNQKWDSQLSNRYLRSKRAQKIIHL